MTQPAQYCTDCQASRIVMVRGKFSGKKGKEGLYFLPKSVMMNANLYINVF